MLEPIRLATPEEVEVIRAASDITPRTAVYAFDNAKTGKPDLAVVRQLVEIDPLYCDSGTPRKVAFIWGMQNILRSFGATEYYFNMPTDDPEWKAAVEKWGAEQISKAPEIRFKKAL